MNKNRKIVAIICAMSMIFSMFAAFTVTTQAADIEKGIVLEYNKDASTTSKAVVDAYYVGMEGVLGYTIKINVPEGAAVAYEPALTGLTQAENLTDGVYGVAAAGTSVVSSADSKIGSLVLTYSGAIPSDTVISLQLESGITLPDGSELYLGEDTTASDFLPVASTTIMADPSATPKPQAQPRPEGNDDPAPSVKDPVVVDKGISLVYNAASTDTKKIVDAYYVGMEGVLGYTIKVNVPEGATVTYEPALTGLTQAENLTDGVYGVAAAGTSVVSSADNKIGSLTFTFENPVTSDIDVTLQLESGVTLPDGSELYLGDDASASDYLKPAWVTIPAATAEFDNEAVLADILTEDISADDTETNSPYYVVVTATKTNGDPAEYGTDYIAYYNGTPLTENQMINYLTGKYGKVGDAIANITFAYNDGIKLDFELDKDGVESPLQKVQVGGGPAPTDAPVKTTTMTVTPTSKTVAVDNSFEIKATVKNPVEGAKVEFTAVNPENKDVISLGTTKVDGNTATVKVRADEIGSASVVVSYVDAEGNAVANVKSTTVKVNVVKASATTAPGSGSSSSSDGSGMGPIAGAPSVQGQPTYPGVSTFTDLESVPWAAEAINTMASKGIVSGRDAYTFDPNANITRAEYCQILVNSIGKASESADSSFDDVATNAWYYHAVSVASKYGIVSGYGDGNFGPNNLITRQDMALMTYKAAQVMGVDTAAIRNLTFGDADQISDYAAEAVTTLSNAGIINGMSEVEFAPKAFATRAQASVILYQTFVK